ncbi:MAG TPA: hypothetical protein DCY56_06825 [Candidatus Omnitrophica bacterium]|nr:hypothetical protein [Candidatus Omnitrophota bacterium]
MKIQELKEDLKILGVGDNLNLALLLYLAATVRKTRYKISVLVSGPAGLGKSHLAKTVLDLFPSEDILFRSRITPASLVRQGDLSDKILFIYEKYEDPQFAQYIRELISEGEVTYSTANEEHVLKGPTTLIETTVNSEIFGIENRSRCFVAGINTSQEAREGILCRQKLLRTVKGFISERATKCLQDKHRTFQKNLNHNLAVGIPFAEQIKLGASPYHAPRIMERTLNLISSITFLNQNQRTVETDGETRYIGAVHDDFYEAKQILTSVHIDEDDASLTRDLVEFIVFLREHKRELFQNRTFTRNQVTAVATEGSRFKNYNVTAKYFKKLSALGFLNELPVRGLKNRIDYSFTDDFPIGSADNLLANCYSTLSLS